MTGQPVAVGVQPTVKSNAVPTVADQVAPLCHVPEDEVNAAIAFELVETMTRLKLRTLPGLPMASITDDDTVARPITCETVR